MRKIDTIIIHCTATPCSMSVSLSDIDKWHRARGFSEVGYHFYINKQGDILKARDVQKQGAHAIGYNATSIGVCYEGGIGVDSQPCDTRNFGQKVSMLRLVYWLSWKYDIGAIFGHNVVSNKACPCFDASGEYSDKVRYMSENKGYYEPSGIVPYSLTAVL